MLRRIMRLLVATLAVTATTGLANHDPAVLKANFLRNFIEFVRWPQERTQITVCAYDKSADGIALDLIDGQKTQKSTLTTRLLDRESLPHGCDVVFVASTDGSRLLRLIEFAQGRPILLVADIEGGAQLGAALSLHDAGGRLGFDANPSSAQANGLKLGSRLLQLARRVH